MPVPSDGEAAEAHRSYRKVSDTLQEGNGEVIIKYLKTLLKESFVDALDADRLKLAYGGVVSVKRAEFLSKFAGNGGLDRSKIVDYLKSVRAAGDADRLQFYFSLGMAAGDADKEQNLHLEAA